MIQYLTLGVRRLFLITLVMLGLCSSFYAEISEHDFKFETSKLKGSSEWQQIDLEETYLSPIVIPTPIYKNDRSPVVVRIRQILDNSFEFKLVHASNSEADISEVEVSFFVVEEGYYTKEQHGIDLIAFKQNSTYIDHDKMWKGDLIESPFDSPVVLGSILTSYDEEFSHFWCSGENRNDQPKTVLRVGQTVDEDPSLMRSNETLGIVFVKPGRYLSNNLVVDAFVTNRTVIGMGSGRTSIAIDSHQPEHAIAINNSMRGSNGGYAVLYGDSMSDALSSEFVHLAIDEDTLSDEERFHTSEYVAVVTFSKSLPKPMITPPIVGVFGLDGGVVSIDSIFEEGNVYYTTDGSLPTEASSLYSEPISVTENMSIQAFLKIDGMQDSQISKTEIIIADQFSSNISSGLTQTWYHWPYESDHVKNTFNEVPNLSGTPIKQVAAYEQPLNQGMGRYSVVEFKGYIIIPEDNTYTFYLDKNSSTCAKLYINDLHLPVLSRSVKGGQSNKIVLELNKGLHPIKIEALNNYWGGSVRLSWQSETIAKSYVPAHNFIYEDDVLNQLKVLIDQDGDGISDHDEITLYNTNHQKKDTDGDQLSDFEEIFTYQTSALNTDSDLNGFSDFDEAKIFYSLNNNSLLGQIHEEKMIPAASFASSKGLWEVKGGEIFSRKFRGEVSYHVTTDVDDIYLLKINGKADSLYDVGRDFDLVVWADGHYVGRQSLRSKSDYRNDDYGMKFTGSITIEEAGEYHFYTSSDDGSQLFIDNQLVVDNDGLHGMKEESGLVQLSEGVHSISVIYFEKSGSDDLKVSYSGPNIEKQQIPSTILSTLQWSYYEGEWSQLPDFEQMFEIKSGTIDNFDLKARKIAQSGSAQFMLPYLSAGQHEIKILWDNGVYDKPLCLESLALLSISGEDENNNGIKDWVDHKLSVEAYMNQQSSSKISPVCLEGKSGYPALMTLNTNDPILPAPNQGWYANIDLNATEPTTVSVSFQNGVKSMTQEITWEPTLVENHSDIIYIRVGDSLLLDPTPEGVSTASKLYIESLVFELDSSSYLPYQFTEAGSYEVTSSYIENDKNIVSTITVIVVDYEAPGSTLVGLLGNERKINLKKSEHIHFEADLRLNAWYKTGVYDQNHEEFAFSMDAKEERTVVARLGENGSILNSIKLQGIDVYGASQTWFVRRRTLEDGTAIADMGIVAYPMLSDVELDVKIFLTGILFTDGLTSKTLTDVDFSDVHEKGLAIYKTSSAPKTAACHHIDVYQNGSFVGRAY